MKIQILGTGCPKCIKLEENAIQAANELNLEFEIEKIKDIQKIIEMGVRMTPAIAVDGRVLAYGHVLSPEGIKKLLKDYLGI
ncbi:MAG: thioredoxin family protein [bacterium]|nr:thioredoxin family protein [bacterium]